MSCNVKQLSRLDKKEKNENENEWESPHKKPDNEQEGLPGVSDHWGRMIYNKISMTNSRMTY